MNDFFKPEEALKSGAGIQKIIDDDMAGESARRAARDETERLRTDSLHTKTLAEHLGKKKNLDRTLAEAEHRDAVEKYVAGGGVLEGNVAKDYPGLASGNAGQPKVTPTAPKPPTTVGTPASHVDTIGDFYRNTAHLPTTSHEDVQAALAPIDGMKKKDLLALADRVWYSGPHGLESKNADFIRKEISKAVKDMWGSAWRIKQ